MTDRPTPDDGDQDPPREDVHLRTAFHHSVDEGIARLHRSWPGLLATGFVGGLDVSLGVLAMLIVIHATGSTILGSLAFSIGFIALMLGRSELFTENFLVPVVAVATGKATTMRVVRLWAGTLLMNLAGGWLFAWLIVLGFPQLAGTAVEMATIFADFTFVQAIALGLIGGAAITLMTWMENGAEEGITRLAAVISMAFLLAAGHLNHVIVVSIEMFIALHTGEAPFGYGAWARIAGIATVTNMVGGLVLVTVLRLLQLGMKPIEEERLRPDNAPRQDEEE